MLPAIEYRGRRSMKSGWTCWQRQKFPLWKETRPFNQ